ncbi:MAG: Ig domain-containing protein [Candidatus Rokuibacteriota bacterium]
MRKMASTGVAGSLLLFVVGALPTAALAAAPGVSVDVEPLYCRGDDVVIRARGTDADGDPLVYTIDPAGDDLPEGLTLGTHSGRIEGILRRNAGEGSSTGYDVTVVVTDPDGNSGSVTFNLFSVACEEPRIARFVLVDAKRDQDVRRLKDGDVIQLGWLSGRFTVRVEVYPETLEESFTGVVVESVRFELDGRRIRTENVPPYALGGDIEGDYASFPISAGVHTLTATPFGANGASGPPGVSKTVTFEVVD